VDLPVGCQDLFGIIAIFITPEIGHLSPGFFHNKPSRAGIPRVKVKLPETLEPAAGHIAQVKACRARPSYGLRGQKKVPEMLKILLHALAKFIGKPCHQEAFFEVFLPAYGYPFTVQEGPFALLRAKKFFLGGIINYSQDRFIVLFKRYGDRVKRESVGKVRGAIDGVYDPFKVFSVPRGPGFFGQKTDVREFLPQGSYLERFNLAIDISHEVDVTLVGYLLDLPGVILEILSGAQDYAGNGRESRSYFFLPL